MLMHSAGRSTGHALVEKTTKPSLIMTPHDGVGGLMPMPKNDSVASASMAVGMLNATETMTGARMFGKRCRDMIRRAGAPIARAASTNSRSLSAST